MHTNTKQEPSVISLHFDCLNSSIIAMQLRTCVYVCMFMVCVGDVCVCVGVWMRNLDVRHVSVCVHCVCVCIRNSIHCQG